MKIPILLIALLLQVLMIPVFSSKIYFTDRGATRVVRCNPDGSELEILYQQSDIPGAGNLRGIAIDPGESALYFCDNTTDQIFRAPMDGEGQVEEVLSSSGFPADISVTFQSSAARTSTQLIWCNRDADAIFRKIIDGPDIDKLIDTPSPYFLLTDEPRDLLIWGDFSAGTIRKTKISAPGEPEILVSGLTGQVRGVRFDHEQNALYWINRNDSKVQRRLLEGTQIEDLYDNLDTPHGMTLDLAARKIYWCDTGTTPGGNLGNAVLRGDMDGSQPPEVLYQGTSTNQPWDIEIDTRVSVYIDWQKRYFRNDAEATQTDMTADPDADGFTNLQEYAFSSHPLDHLSTPSLDVRSGIFNTFWGQRVGLVARTSQSGQDLSYQLETSPDLQNWVTGITNSATLDDGNPDGSFETVFTSPDLPGTRYLRLRVSHQPIPAG